ncbi:MAG: hypothetical protein JSV14_14940 [Deltaproteobacteria bacterium]|nr:MAG: hypothetical protein JSV14_14940 [Deltaproteobacteria bacterium]
MRPMGYIYEPTHPTDDNVIYVGRNTSVSVICRKCRKVAVINLQGFDHYGRLLKLNCGCQSSSRILLERRKYNRRNVRILGEIFDKQNRIRRYPIVVKSLTYNGIGFGRNHQLNYALGHIFRIRLLLANKSELLGNIRIIHSNDFLIGAQFSELVKKDDRKVTWQ